MIAAICGLALADSITSTAEPTTPPLENTFSGAEVNALQRTASLRGRARRRRSGRRAPVRQRVARLGVVERDRRDPAFGDLVADGVWQWRRRVFTSRTAQYAERVLLSPGHYVISGAVLGVAGNWTIEIASCDSELDEYRARAEVPIR